MKANMQMMVITMGMMLMMGVIAVMGQEEASCFLYVNSLNCVNKAQVGGTSFSITKVACFPITHSFTWSSTIDGAGQVAYAMGGTAATSRHLYTLNLTTGWLVNWPRVGNPYPAPYHLAADLRGNGQLYGLWLTNQSYTIVKMNIATGVPAQTFNTGSTYDSCYPSEDGYFDINSTSYVTLWTCSGVSHVVRVNVDTGLVTDTVYDFPPGFSDFGVHAPTGRTFALIGSTNLPISVIYELNADGSLTQVAEVQHVETSWSLYNQIVFIENGVCIYEPNDEKRSHPQPDDLMCTLFGKNGQGFSGSIFLSTPGLSGVPSESYTPFVDHSIPVPC